MESVSPEAKENYNSGDGSGKKHKQKGYWKAARIAAVFGMIEVFALFLWMKSEDFGENAAHYIRWFASCGILAGGAFLAHKLTGGKFKKGVIRGIWIVWAGICVLMYFFPFQKSVLQATVSPQRIQLDDGEWEVDNAVTISNPNPFPLYSVALEIQIDGNSVSAKSVQFKFDPSPPLGLNQAVNYTVSTIGVIFREKGDTIPKILCLYIDVIQAKGSRVIHLKGTIPEKSYANLSVYYSTTTDITKMKTYTEGQVYETDVPFMTPPGPSTNGYDMMAPILKSVPN